MPPAELPDALGLSARVVRAPAPAVELRRADGSGLAPRLGDGLGGPVANREVEVEVDAGFALLIIRRFRGRAAAASASRLRVERLAAEEEMGDCRRVDSGILTD